MQKSKAQVSKSHSHSGKGKSFLKSLHKTTPSNANKSLTMEFKRREPLSKRGAAAIPKGEPQRGSLKKGYTCIKVQVHKCQKNHSHSRKRNHPSTSSINNSIKCHYGISQRYKPLSKKGGCSQNGAIPKGKPQRGSQKGYICKISVHKCQNHSHPRKRNHLSTSSINSSIKCH